MSRSPTGWRACSSSTGWLEVTARRTAADEAVARLAAATLLANLRRGAYVNIGVGLPEEVARAIFEAGRLADVTFVVESGVVGGLPAPGLYFGAALCPERIMSSAEIFALCAKRLDADLPRRPAGRRRGQRQRLQARRRAAQLRRPRRLHRSHHRGADHRVRVARGRPTARSRIDGAGLRIVKRGTPKFVERVDEITFNGRRALAAGKRVFYATHVGLFQLTRRGMELIQVMPGIDVRRDILAATPMPIVLPPSGAAPRVPSALLGT